MIVLDSSAVVAILLHEGTESAVVLRLLEDQDRTMSVASYLEAGTVLAGRRRPHDRFNAIEFLDAFIEEAQIALAPVDLEQIRLALRARIRFGRGMGHEARLNFGDCFSYALAKTTGAPLLYVGNDFSKTDILSALGQTEHELS